MRVYLLDWRGTLNTLPDPIGYVKALRAAGHKACLYTGESYSFGGSTFSDVFHTCDDVIPKWTTLNEIEERCSDWGWGPDLEFIYADDGIMERELVQGLRPSWRVIPPEDLLAELESTNAE